MMFRKRIPTAVCVVFAFLLLPPIPNSGAKQKNICVTASRANLRAGPGKNHRITWEVHRYMPLIQVGQQEDWIKVKDVDNDIHWIYAKLVTDGMECITIKTAKANIRKKASARSQKWFTVEKYSSFLRTGQSKNWIRIKHQGQVMWVHSKLVWPR